MHPEEILDFLNDKQQQSIRDYKYLDISAHQKIPVRKGDYLKFLNKHNYKFIEGGIIIEYDRYPVVRLKGYTPQTFYNIDLRNVYPFHKRGVAQTKRDFFEELLENLGKQQLKKSKQ